MAVACGLFMLLHFIIFWVEDMVAKRLYRKIHGKTDGYHLKKVLKSINNGDSFMSKLETLNQHYQVTSNDFDEGKVAFYPMSLAQYRTYKPYPYHVAKYSSFSWTCISMPTASPEVYGTQVKTSLFAMSASCGFRSRR